MLLQLNWFYEVVFNRCEEAAFGNVAVMMLFVYSFACSVARCECESVPGRVLLKHTVDKQPEALLCQFGLYF